MYKDLHVKFFSLCVKSYNHYKIISASHIEDHNGYTYRMWCLYFYVLNMDTYLHDLMRNCDVNCLDSHCASGCELCDL